MKTLLIMLLSVNGMTVNVEASYDTEADCLSAAQGIQSTEEVKIIDAYCEEPK